MREKSMNSKLQQATDYLAQKDYEQARALLKSMPDDPEARKLLSRLNTAVPPRPVSSTSPTTHRAYYGPGRSQAASPPGSRTYRPDSKQFHVKTKTLDFRVRAGLAVITSTIAIVVAGLFFIFPWKTSVSQSGIDSQVSHVETFSSEYDVAISDEVYDRLDNMDQAEQEVTAWEIWLGQNFDRAGQDDLTLSMEETLDDVYEISSESANYDVYWRKILELEDKRYGGFGSVRLVDRLLILLPLGALAFVLSMVAYARAKDAHTQRRSLTYAMYYALFIFVFPIAWGYISALDWHLMTNAYIHRVVDDVQDQVNYSSLHGAQKARVDEALEEYEEDAKGLMDEMIDAETETFNTTIFAVLGAGLFALSGGFLLVAHGKKVEYMPEPAFEAPA
jgi:hypothetical protein